MLETEKENVQDAQNSESTREGGYSQENNG